MATGNIDDVIAETTQLADSTARALNALNTKIDGIATNLTSEINNLKGLGQPGSGSGPIGGIVTAPSVLSVVSGAVPGTQVATLSAPMLVNPTFEILNPSGRFAINGNNLIVGLVATDISNGLSDSITIRAVGTDGVSQIVEVKPVTIDPPSSVNKFDLNLVTGYHVGGSVDDLINTQSATIQEPNDNGSMVTFLPNERRNTDKGVKTSAEEARYIGAYSLTPTNEHRLARGLEWTTESYDPVAGQAHATMLYPAPAVFNSNSGAEGVMEMIFTEQPQDGDKIVWKYAAKRIEGSLGFYMKLEWNGGFETVIVTNTEADPTGLALVFPQNGYGQVPTANISIIRQHIDVANQVVEVVIGKVLGVGEGGANVKAVVGTAQDSAPYVELGSQITISAGEKGWKDTQAVTVVDAADNYRLAGALAAYLTAATGHVMIETNDIDYASCGGAGVATEAAGSIIAIGNTDLIRPVAPTRFEARGVEKPLGHSGWRGIVRSVITWDATGWKAWVNGSEVASGAGPWGLAGTVHLMRGVSGWIRRVSGGANKLGDVEGRNLSNLINRSYVRPGKAMVPGQVTPTLFITDFSNAIASRDGQWPTQGTPGQPDYIGPDIEQLYKPSWLQDNRRILKPRQFFYQWDAKGSGVNQINNEPQHYVDKEYPGSWQGAYEVVDGKLVQRLKLYDDLTVDEKAAVPTNPVTGLPFEFVSSILTSWGRNDQGGFEQAGGYWEFLSQLPAFHGSWAAIWTYTPHGGKHEFDLEELYGANKTQTTSAYHETNFLYNNGGPVEMGFDMGAQQHSYAFLWDRVAHKITKYVDGFEIKVHPTGAVFDQWPQHLLVNIAIHTGVNNESTRQAIRDGLGVMTTERIQIYQFGA